MHEQPQPRGLEQELEEPRRAHRVGAFRRGVRREVAGEEGHHRVAVDPGPFDHLVGRPVEVGPVDRILPDVRLFWVGFLNLTVGRAGAQSARVEVPFAAIAPTEHQYGSLDSRGELCVPVGRTGATRLQYLRLGRGVAQHMLIAGKTGSGKSTLLHVIITNLALWYAPEQVELYLIDFKKGVEFKSGYGLTEAGPNIKSLAR